MAIWLVFGDCGVPQVDLLFSDIYGFFCVHMYGLHILALLYQAMATYSVDMNEC